MTRYHYIKKCMYLQYRLLMLPNTIHSLYGHYDTSYAKWNSMVPHPPFASGSHTYQEEWNSICEFMRDFDERLEDLK